jgi:hypothetical protein
MILSDDDYTIKKKIMIHQTLICMLDVFTVKHERVFEILHYLLLAKNEQLYVLHCED